MMVEALKNGVYMSSDRYLTKSRFKLACECPTKLFYTRKTDTYPDLKEDDSFLEALAEGGFQVGELAKLHYPGGLDVNELGYDKSVKITDDYIKDNPENTVIYEAAIRHDNLFIRVDIFIKEGTKIQLIEVKAKSFDSSKEKPFQNKSGFVDSTWKPYLYDVAFQKFVIQKAFPDCTVSSYLMLVDRNTVCVEDGLNQKFKVVNGTRKGVVCTGEVSQAHINSQILKTVNVGFEIDLILTNKDSKNPNPLTFDQRVNLYAQAYEEDKKIEVPISVACGKCEFNTNEELEKKGYKSGFKECWKQQLKWIDDDFKKASVLEIWNFRGKQKLMDLGCMRMSDVHEEDINPDELLSGSPMNNKQRQWKQITKYKEGDQSVDIDLFGLQEEMESWVYPLHFIDFETSRVAIPFYAGRRPYEQLAFQFSHHIVHKDGKVEHIGQYLNADSEFPNYDFVRELKDTLSGDEGTIFRYHNHENTVLNEIRVQLEADANPPEDKDELIAFILHITRPKRDDKSREPGQRDMVDLCQLVQEYTFYPSGKGRTSIKVTLPAVLNASKYLQERYSQPIYGKGCEIPSLNFSEPLTWIQKEGDEVLNPYKQLPPMFSGWTEQELEKLDLVIEDINIQEGGSAMMAWAKMHFTEMGETEKNEIKEALLRYCELDTMAMVMIYESWRELIYPGG